MKIKITQTVEVDAEAWAHEYGVELSDVREDVKSYFSNAQDVVNALELNPQPKQKP
jgi:hypothetical protein